ncbi:MAG: hypothetical protein QXU36_08525 [Thermofilum sp.]|uniref:hypothetical protein n=1 Tax=Thermofilum sp. TaxID=1961369 RepID=UPI00316835BD
MTEKEPEYLSFTIDDINQCIIKLQKFLEISENVKAVLSRISGEQPKTQSTLVDMLLEDMLRRAGIRGQDVKKALEIAKRQIPPEVIYGKADSQNSG